MLLWYLYETYIEDESKNSGESDLPDPADEEHDVESDEILPPKNLILYGPPGTGKTYKAIEIAVRACEPQAFTRLDGKEKNIRRRELKNLYDALVEKKRIRFVTFHQSFGYEEFIEGLRAETGEDGSVCYDIKAGVFKQICEDAAFGDATVQLALDDALEEFKSQCAEPDGVTLNTVNGKPFRVSYTNSSTFEIYPLQSKVGQLESGYRASIANIRRLYQGETKGFYNISYVRGILNHLIQQISLPSRNPPRQSANKTMC